MQQRVIAKLSLRLSPKTTPTYDIVRRKFATKQQRERERKKERERASWMPNAMVTAGNTAPQIEFPSSSFIGFARSVNVHNSICFVYAKFNGLSSMVPGYRFWGGAYHFTVFRAHL